MTGVSRESLILTAMSSEGWHYILEEMDKAIDGLRNKVFDKNLDKDGVWDARQAVFAAEEFKLRFLSRINSIKGKVQKDA